MIKDETIVSRIPDLEGLGKKSPSLSFMGGPAMGQLHLLTEGDCTVGRGKTADIVVTDDAISRQHFKIEVHGNLVTIEDLGSTNGTYVNGMRIEKRILNDKDTIQISSQTIISFSYMSDLEAQKQSQIYKMANFDPVTQARTKYYFLDQIHQELAHARRRKTPLSLLMMDIDFFKKINDTYGHLAGDYVLRRVAEMIMKMIRQEDVFARYGGEEFVVLMRETTEGDAVGLAERIRQLIAMTDFEFDQKRFQVTLSAGVSCFLDDNFSTVEEMIKRADEYLYFSKENGRNRVSAYSLFLKR